MTVDRDLLVARPHGVAAVRPERLSARRSVALGVLALLAVLYLSRLAGYPLQDPDEGRYAEIPREMLVSGDWVTPHLNYVEYFEKPPLLYWLVAASFRWFGSTEGAARLVPALAALGTLALTYALSRRLLGARAALLAVVILATTPLFYVFSQFVVIDMLLTFLLTACIGAIWLLRDRSPSETGRWPLIAAASTAALAVLAKGLIGLVLPGLVLLAASLADRDRRTLASLARPGPIVCFLAIAAPWFVVMALRHPEFVHEFFVREHLQRFATDEVGHPEGALFYIPVLLGGALPWTLLATALALTRSGRAAWRSIARQRRRFLLVWIATVVVFFSAARSKLAGYVLPALPPAAMALAAWLDRVDDDRMRDCRLPTGACAGLLLLLGIVLVLAGGVLPILVPWLPRDVVPPTGSEMPQIRFALLMSGCASLAGGVWTLSVTGRGARPLAVSVLATGASLALVLYGLIGVRALVPSSRRVAEAAARIARPGDAIVQYRTLMQGLPFYLRDRVIQVGDPGEVGLGAKRSPERTRYFWDGIDPLAQAWSSERGILVATTPRHLPELMSRLTPTPRIVVHDGRRVLLANHDTR
jgi:4-amino-4-deoxy-L-arabinose transferase-like glycosyltransferase